LAKNYPFYDLSGIFSDTRNPVYLDWCHLGPAGNETVAGKMAERLLGAVPGIRRAAGERPANKMSEQAML
jgi:hypothetical protein